MTGSVLCFGWKLPEAPISAVNPSTVELGSNLPLSTDSSKLPRRLFEVRVAGAEAESSFLLGRRSLLFKTFTALTSLGMGLVGFSKFSLLSSKSFFLANKAFLMS